MAIEFKYPQHVGDVTEYPLAGAVQVKKDNYSAFVDSYPGESGFDGWIRYNMLPEPLRLSSCHYTTVIALSQDPGSPVFTAGQELKCGIGGLLCRQVNVVSGLPSFLENTIVVATVDSFVAAGGQLPSNIKLEKDGFCISSTATTVSILALNERGALYGAFEFLSLIAQGRSVLREEYVSNPGVPIRWSNQWDNPDGTIERGYSGRSTLFANGAVVQDLNRAKHYARLLASIRLNGLIVNNVNAGAQILSDANLQGLKRLADVMRPYGVQIGISVYFDSPVELGGLPTSDPLDQAVIKWWEMKTAEIHRYIPDFCGFTVKASAEGQPGPLSHGRTLADAANMFARALRSNGDGCVLYRAFMYNDRIEESNWHNDRANAAVDNFAGLDGQFDENVIVQIKFGPIDFQVREPVHPLFAHLRHTNVAIEFQVVQEYNGQQTHTVYQAPLWNEILNFDLRLDGHKTMIRDLLTRRCGTCSRTGMASVVNVGSDPTWMGHHLAMANLFAFGHLAWDPSLDAEDLAREWSLLTFGPGAPRVIEVTTGILMESWPAYEGYTGNLGIQTLADLTYTHFGPFPDCYDGNSWGQWTRANRTHIGMDRTTATGTGNAGYYPPEVATIYEDLHTTPDELVLWFHHVPYTHRLKSGKTVIQHIYDAHYDGAIAAQSFVERWRSLQGLVDEKRFQHVLLKLTFQAGHAIVWRDAITKFYYEKSGIKDEKGRVGNYEYRVEAEDMQLDGYEIVELERKHMASGGRAIVISSGWASATARTRLDHITTGIYDLAVNYFDHYGGKAKYQVYIREKNKPQRIVGEWVGDMEDKLGHDFSEHLDGHSATRITFPRINLEVGSELIIIGVPEGIERAALDYISIFPVGVVD